MNFCSDTARYRVVLGVSSVGKSTYIANLVSFGGVPENTRVLLAYELENEFSIIDGYSTLIHYNALRPFKNKIEDYENSIESDKLASEIFRKDKIEIVDIIVARRATIAKRILLRDFVESELRGDQIPYVPDSIYELISTIRLRDIYERWEKFLDRKKIRYRFVSGENPNFGAEVSKNDAWDILCAEEPIEYTDGEKIKALGRFEFPYQSKDGKNCGESIEAIRPYLEGDSLLDVGCAEGAFCFEAERLGFTDILGIDLKKERLLAAYAYRDVSGSRCRFSLCDLHELPRTKSYDVILLLNVLHHLHDPIGALRSLSKICTHRLIIEYPTLSDPKLNATTDQSMKDLNSFPLIGVSLVDSQDQTYLFTDLAIQRICIENMKLFKKVEFIPSPRAQGRSIAILEMCEF